MNRKRKPNRTVALLTPIAAGAAGLVSAWLAKRLGVEVDEGVLQQVFIVGALAVVAPALQWLNGWQKYEARQAELERELVLQNAAATTGAEGASDVADGEDGEDEDLADELEELDELEDLAELDFDDEELEEDEPAAVGG